MEAAIEVASNLREDDYREVYEGHGHFPLLHLPLAAFIGDKTGGIFKTTLRAPFNKFTSEK